MLEGFSPRGGICNVAVKRFREKSIVKHAKSIPHAEASEPPL